MESVRGFLVFTMLCALLGVYLFASAPAPLAEPRPDAGKQLSVQTLFELCAAENASVRQLYTESIVAAGKQVGLRFDEAWRTPTLDAGPLPALFLREASRALEKRARLGLYLGSDYPVRRANLFTGASAEAFAQLRRDREPRFFYMADVQLHTGMFPDLASVKACVECHNQHPDSAKHDWKLGDVMGAVTWTYPESTVSLSEALMVLGALRSSFRDAYEAYLAKVRTFRSPPEIGSQWPTHGYYLPTSATFMDEMTRRSSSATLERLLSAT
jgi:adenylate cyclase